MSGCALELWRELWAEWYVPSDSGDSCVTSIVGAMLLRLPGDSVFGLDLPFVPSGLKPMSFNGVSRRKLRRFFHVLVVPGETLLARSCSPFIACLKFTSEAVALLGVPVKCTLFLQLSILSLLPFLLWLLPGLLMLTDCRWMLEATEFLVMTLPLRASIFFENVELSSHDSCRRFWYAQSCLKALIWPV